MQPSEPINLPPEAAKQIEESLEQASRDAHKRPDAVKIFIGIPNMAQINVGLAVRLFSWTKNENIIPWYHFVTEKRHQDCARNILVEEFLKSNCEWCAMIDADVNPSEDFIELYKHGKDIISATAHCWINGELIPSVWQLAECEECFCLNAFMKEDRVHDPSFYRRDGDFLHRWNPERQTYELFANKYGIIKGKKCRCKGTGMDPWVYRTWQQKFEPGKLIKADSIGAAAMMIHRRVFEGMSRPFFQFYYRENRSILLTEDHYFCWKAQLEGFEVWADMQMVASHYKEVDLVHVLHRMIKSFERGVDYERKQKAKPASVVVPSTEDIEKYNNNKIILGE